jgi:hypothetical protein
MSSPIRKSGTAGESSAATGDAEQHPERAAVPPPSPRQVGFTTGVALIVLGGLIAAVTGPLDLDRGSWLAAYLVLVGGVAQCVISTQHRLAAAPLTPRGRRWMLLLLWNTGVVIVIVGSLTSAPWVGAIGGVALLAALVLAMDGTRHARRRVVAILLRILYAALAVSVVIGVALTALRAAG